LYFVARSLPKRGKWLKKEKSFNRLEKEGEQSAVISENMARGGVLVIQFW